MEKRRTSQPENQKEVYKFWLGFVEKIAVLISAVIIIPRVIGQLNYSFVLVIMWVIVFILLCSVLMFLSLRIWYLPKDDEQEEKKT
jgi:hypothetical protein